MWKHYKKWVPRYMLLHSKICWFLLIISNILDPILLLFGSLIHGIKKKTWRLLEASQQIFSTTKMYANDFCVIFSLCLYWPKINKAFCPLNFLRILLSLWKKKNFTFKVSHVGYAMVGFFSKTEQDRKKLRKRENFIFIRSIHQNEKMAQKSMVHIFLNLSKHHWM